MRTTSIMTIATLIFAALMSLAGTQGRAAAHQSPAAQVSDDIRANLIPPADSILLFEFSARGDQIYTYEAKPDDASAFVWTFKAPEADLLNRHGDVVGTHFAGPTWQGTDGSAVIAAVRDRADSPDAGAIHSPGSSSKRPTTPAPAPSPASPTSSASTPSAALHQKPAATPTTPAP